MLTDTEVAVAVVLVDGVAARHRGAARWATGEAPDAEVARFVAEHGLPAATSVDALEPLVTSAREALRTGDPRRWAALLAQAREVSAAVGAGGEPDQHETSARADPAWWLYLRRRRPRR